MHVIGGAEEFEVAFFGCHELQAFDALDRGDVLGFEEQAKEPLDAVVRIVQTEERRRVNGIHFSVGDGFDAFAGDASGEQAFGADDDLVGEGEVLGDVVSVFQVMNPCAA